MPKNNIIKYALANSLLTVFYITLVGVFFSYANQIFGRGPDGNNALIPMVMIMFFVLSATITGSLVLGRPILWYIDGNKKDALYLFGYTVMFFAIVTVLMFVVMYFVR